MTEPKQSTRARLDDAMREAGPLDIMGCQLFNTCGACPEQYDVYKGDLQIGYLRLRHGKFRADFGDCGGKTVFEAEPEGDGVFLGHERQGYLEQAVAALLAELRANAPQERKE